MSAGRIFGTFLASAILTCGAELRGTWAAAAGNGVNLAGAWTAEPQQNGTVTGTWTLQDSNGRILLQGAWSASKAAKSWDGAWRAVVSGNAGERAGTWSAAVSLPLEAGFAAMLEAASKAAVSGTWKAGAYSGSWSIRAAP